MSSSSGRKRGFTQRCQVRVGARTTTVSLPLQQDVVLRTEAKSSLAERLEQAIKALSYARGVRDDLCEIHVLVDSWAMPGCWIPKGEAPQPDEIYEEAARHRVSRVHGGTADSWASRVCWTGASGCLVFCAREADVQRAKSLAAEQALWVSAVEPTGWAAYKAWKSRREAAWLAIEGEDSWSLLAVDGEDAAGFVPGIQCPGDGVELADRVAAGALALGVNAVHRTVWCWSPRSAGWEQADRRFGEGRSRA